MAELAGGLGSQARLAQALDLLHELGVLGHQEADAQAARGVGLGHGVHDHEVILHLGRQLEGAVGRLVEPDAPVDLVGDDGEVVALGPGGQALQVLASVHGAGGVAGVAEHEQAGAGTHGVVELLVRGQGKAVFQLGAQGLDPGAGHGREAVVVGVVRLQDQDLVAGVAQGGEGEEQGLGAAGGDHHVLGGQAGVPPAVVGGGGLAAGGQAAGGTVGDHVGLVGRQGLEHGQGRGHVGLPDVESMEGHLGEGGDGLVELANGALLKHPSAFGQARHGSSEHSGP